MFIPTIVTISPSLFSTEPLNFILPLTHFDVKVRVEGFKICSDISEKMITDAMAHLLVK